MPSRSSTHTTLSHAEWDLLVRLPGQVVIAATSAGADTPDRTLAEGLAGLNAIAAGRSSTNPLVRRVVETIYAERDDDVATTAEFVDRSVGQSLVLASCREAAAILTQHCAEEDRAAYRRWLESIAERVGDASTSGAARQGSGQISPDERRFLNAVSAALGG